MAHLLISKRLPLLPNLALPGALFHRSYSTEGVDVPANVPEPMLSSKNVAQFRKGTGGRASFSGNVVTVFGSSGFTGLAVVNRLAKHGNQLILPYRCDAYFMRELKVVGELGQILFFPFQLKDDDSIRKAVKYSNVVVNLIGTYFDTPNYKIEDTNIEGARRIARICREMGVERLVHVSAMGADPEHKSRYIKNGRFLKTKGLGEQAVRDEFPSATIVRPSVLYGERDHFLYKLISHFRRVLLIGLVYVWNGGKGVYKMPLYVNDFSFGIARIISDPSTAGKTFEFVGPHCYEMCELVDFIFRRAQCVPEVTKNYRRTSIPDPYFLASSFLCWLNTKYLRSFRSYIDYEWLDFVEATSDVLTGGNTMYLQDLGVQPKEFEYMGGWYCLGRSFSMPLELQFGEVPEPALPLRSPILYKTKSRRLTLEQIPTERRAFGLDRKVVSPT